MSISNSAFEGSVPDYYDKYLGPLVFEDYSIDLANRIQVNGKPRILEIAAGTGIATRHISQRISSNASLIVTDLNEGMLEIAKTKTVEKGNIEFRTADGQDLPFNLNSFDVVVCQFGIMFFPDKEKGMAESFRVLKPGGKYIFNVWDTYDKNPLIKLVNDSVLEMFPVDPPSFLEVPMGYNNLDQIISTLVRVGFRNINVDILTKLIKTDDPKNVPYGFILGNPLAEQIANGGGNLKEVVEEVTARIAEVYGTSTIQAKMQAIVFEASKPI